MTVKMSGGGQIQNFISCYWKRFLRVSRRFFEENKFCLHRDWNTG